MTAIPMIIRVIFEELPKHCFPWNQDPKLSEDENQIQNLIEDIRSVFCTSSPYYSNYHTFPPKPIFIKFLLADFFNFLDKIRVEYPLDIYNIYSSLRDSALKVANAEQNSTLNCWNYRSYYDPNEAKKRLVLVKTCNLMIFDGATGLSIWPASLVLADFFYFNTEIDLTIKEGGLALELGSGTGFTGILFSKLARKRKWNYDFVYLSDCDEKVLSLLSDNIVLNEVQNSCSVINLNWENPNVLDWSKVKLIFASDIVYCPESIDPLCKLLENIRNFPLVIFCITVRNEETWSQFLQVFTKKFKLDFLQVKNYHFSCAFPIDFLLSDVKLFKISKLIQTPVVNEV